MEKLKLLYAEDEVGTRKNHIIYLQSRYDLTIYEASDGLEALELYKKHTPDIVLTDITMPKLSGLELAREIRRVSKHTKLIILTAHSEQEQLLEALELDVVNYLVKPIDRQRLRESIDVAIETLPQEHRVNKNIISFGNGYSLDIQKEQYYANMLPVKLSKSEMDLLVLLCKHPNVAVSSYDIFINVWNDFDKEFSSESIRTLVKKVRKKLPDDILQNLYGGFYKITV